LPFKKIGGDVIAQKPMTPLKQVVRHRMAPFKTKSTRPSDLPKNITQRYCEPCSKLYVQFLITIFFETDLLIGLKREETRNWLCTQKI
jgi:hypothetical protein